MTLTRAAGVLLVCALSASTALALVEPEASTRVLDNFDSRRLPGVSLRSGPSPAQASELALLQAELGAPVRASFSPVAGTLRSLSAVPRTGLTGRSAGDPETVARRFIARFPALFGGAGWRGGLQAERIVRETGTGAARVRFVQTLNGIGVFDGAIRVKLDAEGRIERITGHPWDLEGSKGSLSKDFEGAMTPEQAVLAASMSVRPELSFQPVRTAGPDGAERLVRFEQGPYADPITARWIYFPSPAGPAAAYLVTLRPGGFPQSYEVIVGARDGRLLHRANLYRYVVDGIGRLLDEAPNTRDDDTGTDTADEAPAGSLADVTNHNVKALGATPESPLGVLDTSGFMKGNNVHVFDGGSPNEGENRPGFDFDFPFNTRGSSQANLFNVNNFVHDYFYILGFDEVNGNFQKDNRGLLPAGDGDNDEVHADSWDTAGRNNASFGTPVDGGHGNMNMFLWDPVSGDSWGEDVNGDGTLDLDGSYDSDIIIHEFHHGVSNRLAGGRNLASCFNAPESGAMGEGGGDFFAYTINDDTLLADWVRPPNGLRRINSKHYGNFTCQVCSPTFRSCAVHSNGEIWANALWDIRQRFIADNVGGARFRALDIVARLYVDGLKTAPCDPDMLEMRDEMIAADEASYAGRNECRLWEEFAGRGLGVSALSADRRNTCVTTAAFDVPSACAGGGPPPPAPGEVTGLRFVSTDTLRWDPEFDAATYQVYRSTAAAVAGGDYGSCVSGSDTDASDVFFTDATLPATGAALTYLVTARNVSGEGTAGSRSDDTPRSIGTPCP